MYIIGFYSVFFLKDYGNILKIKYIVFGVIWIDKFENKIFFIIFLL